MPRPTQVTREAGNARLDLDPRDDREGAEIRATQEEKVYFPNIVLSQLDCEERSEGRSN